MKANPSRRQMLLLAAIAALPEELLAQDAARIQPDSYRVALDNAQVRVLEFNARPGMGVCGTGLHSHPAHLTIALTAARVRVKQNGKTFVAELPAGAVFWSEAETHETENLLGTNSRALLVELKRT
ncbi:MAG: hypothetical protein ACR2GP_10270 [Burkholderiaceae bacterium]